MPPVAVPWFASCIVLGLAGAAKTRRPEPTVGALRAARLPASVLGVRLLGAAEIGLAVLGLVSGSALVAATVAGLYLAFAAFVAAAMRRGGAAQSCGCFGFEDVPASSVHVVVNLACAAIAVSLLVAQDVPTLGTGESAWVGAGLATVAAVQVAGLLTIVPRVASARRQVQEVYGW